MTKTIACCREDTAFLVQSARAAAAMSPKTFGLAVLLVVCGLAICSGQASSNDKDHCMLQRGVDGRKANATVSPVDGRVTKAMPKEPADRVSTCQVFEASMGDGPSRSDMLQMETTKVVDEEPRLAYTLSSARLKATSWLQMAAVVTNKKVVLEEEDVGVSLEYTQAKATSRLQTIAAVTHKL